MEFFSACKHMRNGERIFAKIRTGERAMVADMHLAQCLRRQSLQKNATDFSSLFKTSEQKRTYERSIFLLPANISSAAADSESWCAHEQSANLLNHGGYYTYHSGYILLTLSAVVCSVDCSSRPVATANSESVNILYGRFG
jgi:hypothetical protein